MHIQLFSVGTGLSLAHLGTVWPVIHEHGKCGCGLEEMRSTVAYFTLREDAERYATFRNQCLQLRGIESR